MHEPLRRSIISAGYVPLDIVHYGQRVWHAAGGTAGNVAAILGFLGWDAAIVADLGDDLAGRLAVRDLKKSNVSVELIRLTEGRSTPRIVHCVDRAGPRYLFKCPACAQSLPSSRPLRTDRAEEVAHLELKPDVFFFDRLNAGTLLLAERFSATGSLIVFEPSRPARSHFVNRAVAVADVVKQSDDRETGLENSIPRPGQVGVTTGGACGAQYRVGNGKWHSSPAFSYPVVDAGGAGDWTTAGLVHSLPLRGRRTVSAVAESMRWAQALAAVSCGAAGARGLSRQQTAEAVVRAARFLQSSGQAAGTHQVDGRRRDPSVPASSCRWCLLDLPCSGSIAATVDGAMTS